MRPISYLLIFAFAGMLLPSCSKSGQAVFCQATVLNTGEYCGSDTRIRIDAGADQVLKMLQLGAGTGITVFGLYNLPDKYKVVGAKLSLGVSMPANNAICPAMFLSFSDLNVVFVRLASK